MIKTLGKKIFANKRINILHSQCEGSKSMLPATLEL
jgi:hypothetical protein